MIRNRIIIFTFLVFFCYILYFLFNEIKHDYVFSKDYGGLVDDELRQLYVGSLYGFIENCKSNIDENADILLFTDNPGEGLLMSYYLYPRKLYVYISDPIRKKPPKINDIDPDFLNGRKIQWIIFRFSKKYINNSILKLENGKAVKIMGGDRM